MSRQQLHADAIFNIDAKTNTNRDQTAALGKRIDERFSEIEQQNNQQIEAAASDRAADARALGERFDQGNVRIDAIEEQQRVQSEAIQRPQAQPKTWAQVFTIIWTKVRGLA